MALFFLIWFAIALWTAGLAARNGRFAFGWFILGMIFGIFALGTVAVLGPLNPKAVSLTAQLGELERLRRRGRISAEEFDRKKASLLA